MLADRIGNPVLRFSEAKIQLAPEYRGKTDLSRSLGKPDYAIEPVVIRQGQCLEAEPGCLRRQLLWM